MDIKVEIEGEDEIIALFEDAAALPNTPSALQAVVDASQTMAECILEALDRFVYHTPLSKSGYQRTGRLRDGTTAMGKATRKGDYIQGGVESTEEYAVHVEYGTENADGETIMAGRPFMRAGADESIDEVCKDLVRWLQTKIT